MIIAPTATVIPRWQRWLSPAVNRVPGLAAVPR
jgi:hypothetical protein